MDFIVNGSNGYQVDPLDIHAVVNKMALALGAIDRNVLTRVSREFVLKVN